MDPESGSEMGNLSGTAGNFILVSKIRLWDGYFFYRLGRRLDMAQISGLDYKIQEMASRIRELREIEGLTTYEMAAKTQTTREEYLACESGTGDLNFTFIYRCALALGVDVTDIIEGYFTPSTIKLTAVSVVILVAALIIGNIISKRMSRKVFLILTYILMLISGASLLIK